MEHIANFKNNFLSKSSNILILSRNLIFLISRRPLFRSKNKKKNNRLTKILK